MTGSGSGAAVAVAAPDVFAASWQQADATLPQVVARLKELRHRAAAGGTPGRAVVLNLVLWSSDVDPGTAAQLADRLSGTSRLLVMGPKEGDGIDARVEVSGRAQAAGGGIACEEIILLLLGPAVAEHASSAATPLLRGNVPVVVVWPGAPEPRLPAYRELVGLADRLVLESTRPTGPDPPPPGPRALGLVAGEIAEGRAAVTDIAWAYVTPWRQLLAQMLRPDQVAALRRGPSQLVVTYCGSAPTLEALLLAGWLRDLLGAGLGVELQPLAGGVALAAFDLQGPGGRRLHVARDQGQAGATVTVGAPGEPPRERTLPLPAPDRIELLAGELEIRAHDRTFERAVDAAGGLART